MVDLRLTTPEMAEFVTNGYVRLDEVVPADLCQRMLEEIASGRYSGDIFNGTGQLLSEQWVGLGMQSVLQVPRVRATIESLVGPDPRFDHYAVHVSPAQSLRGQDVHQDAEYDLRRRAFDIQASFFFHDVPAEMGGTLLVPGTHFRRVRESAINRYQNIVGQVQTVCKAGTVIFWHHNLWHSGRGNSTDRVRYMFKVRMNPRVKQEKLWNVTEMPPRELRRCLEKHHAWSGNDSRTEILNRIQMWRFLTGDPTYDCSSWWSRIENER
ncbi:MAG: phytanoyl-CoA dioxygenase family protein [Polyangiaceae bacterium]|nr:phytanoyl-CoA dioxygenase family protein [Polyangiaceae bacterium]